MHSYILHERLKKDSNPTTIDVPDCIECMSVEVHTCFEFADELDKKEEVDFARAAAVGNLDFAEVALAVLLALFSFQVPERKIAVAIFSALASERLEDLSIHFVNTILIHIEHQKEHNPQQ